MLDFLMEENRELFIFLVSMIPVIELRGAIPLGISLGMSPTKAAIISVIGNALIVPILLLILNPIMNFLGKTKIFAGLVKWIKAHTMKKTRDKIRKYSSFGLFIFVAIPLPTTGVWTAAAAASFLKMNFRDALISIVAGVMTAGVIVYIISTLTKAII